MQMLDDKTKKVGEETEEVEEVTWKDQKMINQFSNLNIKSIKLKKIIKIKSLELDDLVELENDLLLSSFDDDDPDNLDLNNNDDDKNDLNSFDNDFIMYKLDSSYIHMKRSQFQETSLAKNLEDLKLKISNLNSELTNLNDQMSDLKKNLYSKFGNTINLEGGDDEDDDDII